TSPSMPDGVSPQERGLPLVKDTSGHTGAHAVSTKPFGAVFSDTMNTITYAPTAYRLDRIPAQLPSSERSCSKKWAGSACLGVIRRSWHRPGSFIKTALSGYASGSRWSGKTQKRRPMEPINPESRKRKTFTISMIISDTVLLNSLLGGGSG